MTIRNLRHMFHPRSVALIGASATPGSVGATVLQNLLGGGFTGPLFAVNPKHRKLAGQTVYPSIAALPEAPDLAVVCTPAATVPGVIAELGARGTKAAIVISACMTTAVDAQGKPLVQAMLEAARPHLLRVLGPNCVGLLAPGIGLNASFAQRNAIAGKIAFVSQSGALVTGVLDWASSRGIGFSKFVSLGNGADVDFGDMLDYLASDGETQAILLYVEGIRQARKFMSAARAAARSKPVIVVKAGRVAEGARAAKSHTGAMAGSDDVYDAALRRAGMLRVFSTEQLFNAVETLAHARPFYGDRLAIMSNGGGPAVMATDELIARGGRLAVLSQASRSALDAVLPPGWSGANPVDIIGDAPAQRYQQALQILQQDDSSDALLFIHAPSAIVDSADIASALAPLVQKTHRTVLACWLGGECVARARHIFMQAGVACYDTPEEAVRGFMQIADYRRNQTLLMQVPPAIASSFRPDTQGALAMIRQAIADGQTILTEPQSKAVLAAYGIPVVNTRIAGSVDAALAAAEQIGYPVALKILSPQVTHKTEVGGVALDLETPAALRDAAQAMGKRLRELRPQAQLQGFSVQAMARRVGAHELIVGISTDPVFGPVILFGQGGIAVEVTADRAVGLPPLNMVLARDLVSRTRVSRLLSGYRHLPPANLDALCQSLIQVAQMASDLAQIAELDINPLLVDGEGVLALDARIRINAAADPNAPRDRLAIRPYPQQLEEAVAWKHGPLLLRPIRPEDGAEHLLFFRALDPQDVRYRAFTFMRELQAPQLARLTQIDYDREMAFIACRNRPDGSSETLGVARAIADPNNLEAEFAIVIRSDCKGMGLGRLLMQKLIDYCRSRGTRWLVGDALSENRAMLGMMRNMGFTVGSSFEPGAASLRMRLNEDPAGSAA